MDLELHFLQLGIHHCPDLLVREQLGVSVSLTVNQFSQKMSLAEQQITTDLKELKKDPDHPILDLLAERWSPVTFSDRFLAEETLQILFEAARWAPSSNNLQPWYFIYTFRTTEAFEKIYQCLSEYNQSWVQNAPVLMLAIVDEKTEDGKENYHALHDLGLAMGNMIMQAQSMEIATHMMAGVDWKKAQKVFEIPEAYHVATAIAVGYYGGDPDDLKENLREREFKPGKRKPLDQLARRDSWWELKK